jgi:peptidoglycan/LPS O-acetylase OafA/YrhL
MLRGLAALAVVFFHILGHSSSPTASLAIARVVSDYGWLGVPVFFVISGFVIAHSMRDARVTWAYSGRYALRRMARLDPPYWTTIAVALLFKAAVAVVNRETIPVPSWQNVLAHLVYLQGVLEYPHASQGLWTLCLEVQFYLSMLALVAICQRARLNLALATAVLGIAALALSPRLHKGHGWTDAYRSLAPNYAMFAIGILTWCYCSGRIAARWWLAFMLVVTLRQFWRVELELVAALIAGAAIAAQARGYLKIPAVAPLMWLGTISYSLYLSHPIAGRFFRIGVSKLTGIQVDELLWGNLAAVSFCLPVAYVMYRVVELPSMRLSEWLKGPTIASAHATKHPTPDPVAAAD